MAADNAPPPLRSGQGTSRPPAPPRDRLPVALFAAASVLALTGFILVLAGLIAVHIGTRTSGDPLRVSAGVDAAESAPISTAAPTFSAPTPIPTTQPTPASALPERCARAELAFPEWRDPEGAIQQAVAQNLKERGINPYRTNPFLDLMLKAYAVPPDDAVAGWIAYSLYWTHKGHGPQVFSLKEYVERQQRMRLALGSMLRPDYLGAVLTRDEWSEMQGWPASTCPGAMLRNPDNTRLVRLMGKSVGDTAWLKR